MMFVVSPGIFEQIVQLPFRHRSRSIIVPLPLLAWIVDELEAIVIERRQTVTLEIRLAMAEQTACLLKAELGRLHRKAVEGLRGACIQVYPTRSGNSRS